MQQHFWVIRVISISHALRWCEKVLFQKPPKSEKGVGHRGASLEPPILLCQSFVSLIHNCDKIFWKGTDTQLHPKSRQPWCCAQTRKSGGAPLLPLAPPAPSVPPPLVLHSAVPSQGRFCFGDAQTRLKSHHLFSFVAWSVNLSSCSPLRAYFSAELSLVGVTIHECGW